jgi:ubiquinone/menaquinone biosynthesis C-methylase UbiE
MKKFNRDENNQKKYYNNISEEYEEHYASESSYYYRSKIYENFLRKFDFKGKEILDAMGGSGQSSAFFIRQNAKITALDISEKQCELFRIKFPNFKIVCASILDSGFENNNFDFIVTDSLHHLHPNVDDCMKEFYRILKPGGHLLLWEPSAGSILNLLRKIWYKLDKKYFQENEKAINLNKLINDQKKYFKIIKYQYGGNIGYIFQNITMALRLPILKSKKIFKYLTFIEIFLIKFQSKYISLWFLALFKKN